MHAVVIAWHFEGMDRMTLPMNWDEWAQHDGTALAARVRKGELTATELAAQAAAGIQGRSCAVGRSRGVRGRDR
jgi:hypothetical protein